MDNQQIKSMFSLLKITDTPIKIARITDSMKSHRKNNI